MLISGTGPLTQGSGELNGPAQCLPVSPFERPKAKSDKFRVEEERLKCMRRAGGGGGGVKMAGIG